MTQELFSLAIKGLTFVPEKTFNISNTLVDFMLYLKKLNLTMMFSNNKREEIISQSILPLAKCKQKSIFNPSLDPIIECYSNLFEFDMRNML